MDILMKSSPSFRLLYSVFCFTALAPPLMTSKTYGQTHSQHTLHLTRPTLRAKKTYRCNRSTAFNADPVVHRLLYMQLAHYKRIAIVTMILMTSILIHTDLYIYILDTVFRYSRRMKSCSHRCLSLPLQMAERLLRAQPVSVANHVKARERSVM